jgi:hypothetical protein
LETELWVLLLENVGGNATEKVKIQFKAELSRT